MNRTSLRSRLRAATQSRHAVLDRLAGPVKNAAAYHAYLTGIATFRFSVEQSLKTAPWPEILATWKPKSLSALIIQDLDDLRLDVPSLLEWPAPDSPAATLGTLYVLEGSTLGARFLVRQAASHGFTDQYGARHLNAQADNLSGWQAFVERLERYPGDPTDAENTAIRTFDLAISAMQQPHSVRSLPYS
ncbi:biliverdin-producing heme oxygenase [Acetobacter sp. UBA5411]|uniref:biliverdin-producing heme oxygenase n=1 Tax=Acetobacter sp. UBA5411 TaxID=1945905 RepID=UPI0025BB425F|nr:biliverdin-producing heme oxygenase [Acetobacter sp. UBA5411]